jgi:hypothetical protein
MFDEPSNKSTNGWQKNNCHEKQFDGHAIFSP